MFRADRITSGSQARHVREAPPNKRYLPRFPTAPLKTMENLITSDILTTNLPTLFAPIWFGTVDSTDLFNPTRQNTYRQDFLLLDIRPLA